MDTQPSPTGNILGNFNSRKRKPIIPHFQMSFRNSSSKVKTLLCKYTKTLNITYTITINWDLHACVDPPRVSKGLYQVHLPLSRIITRSKINNYTDTHSK